MKYKYKDLKEFLEKERFLKFDDKSMNLEELNKHFEEKQKEIDILNNIIDELEKYLIEEIKKEKAFCSRRYEEEGIINSLTIEGTFEQILNKLKELKEGK